MTLAFTDPHTFTLGRVFDDAPALAVLTVIILLSALPLLAAYQLDPRQFQGDSIWLKPLKFHAALAIYLGTLAIFARWLPEGMMQSRGWQVYQGVVIACILAELLWIGGAAALGTASHFNQAGIWGVLYELMGLAAVTLTSLSLVMGVAIWRNAATGLAPAVQLSIALGLVLTFVLTVVVAGAMASGTGHFVGTPITGARVPVMGWSREVGDLRLPHFLATHALHALPVVGLLAARFLPETPGRLAVWAAALGFTGLVALTFAQALSGRPTF
ncbi:hypothetical protein L2E76_11345 [Planktothrix agardhii 1811]|uniref:hypothetical protein n=1 Tax=Planktothrix agardhii TaxID=1160 RepID=UPI001F2F6672|nr:hypothetical protein [Planktothrix agardhii]MCF3581112.1 hypothetical protein [Planktothrix agardhii 1811]